MQETFIALKSHYIVNQKWSETKGKKNYVCMPKRLATPRMIVVLYLLKSIKRRPQPLRWYGGNVKMHDTLQLRNEFFSCKTAEKKEKETTRDVNMK